MPNIAPWASRRAPHSEALFLRDSLTTGQRGMGLMGTTASTLHLAAVICIGVSWAMVNIGDVFGWP